jgi:hypothetical protein
LRAGHLGGGLTNDPRVEKAAENERECKRRGIVAEQELRGDGPVEEAEIGRVAEPSGGERSGEGCKQAGNDREEASDRK